MTPESYIDSLTHLPNRALFEDRVEQSVAQARRSGEQIAIHYVELDHLRGLLETHGKRIAEGIDQGRWPNRIRGFIRKSDTLARLEGGEFAIIQRGVPNSMGVTTLVQRVLDALDDPIVVEGLELRTSASVGISLLSPECGTKRNHGPGGECSPHGEREEPPSLPFSRRRGRRRDSDERWSYGEQLENALDRGGVLSRVPTASRSESRPDHRCRSADSLAPP